MDIKPQKKNPFAEKYKAKNMAKHEALKAMKNMENKRKVKTHERLEK